MRKPEWYDDRDEVLAFARTLVDRGEITDLDALLYFFEKPWKWTPEHEAYTAGVIGREGAAR